VVEGKYCSKYYYFIANGYVFIFLDLGQCIEDFIEVKK
jgi:hypothetical protein